MSNLAVLSQKMQLIPFRWMLNFFLVVIIFGSAEAGRLLGIHQIPLAISAVWAPTGFSLAALLLFGFRAWPGVLIGNFCYNAVHLLLNEPGVIEPLIVALVIALGSLAQALLGGSCVRRFCSRGYFNTVKDILYFLLFGGVLTCFIASSVGMAAFYLYGALGAEPFGQAWLTFWLGDLMGVFIFTPLIVILSLKKLPVHMKEYEFELIWMIVLFAILNYLVFIENYPIAYLFLLFNLWVTCRFHFHGATIGSFLITIFAIAFTSTGGGEMVITNIPSLLLVVVGLLNTIVISSLIIAAVLNEREMALSLIPEEEKPLAGAPGMYAKELLEMRDEVFTREKLQSFGLLTSGIANQIQIPLKNLSNSLNIGSVFLQKLQELWKVKKPALETELATHLELNLNSLQQAVEQAREFGMQATRIAQILHEQAALTMPGKIEAHSLHVNRLLDMCLAYVAAEEARRAPDFICTVVKEYGKEVKMRLGFSENMAHAFIHLLYNSFYSMKFKKEQLGASYVPVLEVRTSNRESAVEIVIRDNGMGLPEEQLPDLFQSFVQQQPEKEAKLVYEAGRLSLAFAHDIVVYVHRGEITVQSEEGQFLLLTITLPKES